MIRLKLTNDKLIEAYKIAEREGRTLLGVLYNDYICPYFPNSQTVSPRNIHANRELVMKMIELDKKLKPGGVDMIYLQYGPSIKPISILKKDEMMIV